MNNIVKPNKYHNMHPNRHIIDLFQHYVNKEDFTCLEIGCNSGYNLKALNNIFPNAQYYGCDNNKEAILEAQHNFPQGYFYINDIEKNSLSFYLKGKKFDYIFLPDVLEHLTQPKQVLITIKEELLKQDGLLFLDVPNLLNYQTMYNLLKHGLFTYTDFGLLDYDHKHLFTYNELIKMLNETGYIILHIDGPGIKTFLNPEEQKFINELKNISQGNLNDQQFIAYQWYVIAK